MRESFDVAKEDLKRVDHLIFVSLKYTRTVDVLRNIIKRLIATYDAVIDALLKHAEEKNKTEEKDFKELAPVAKSILVKKLFEDPQLNDYLKFYLFLRKINRAKYKSKREYRRHVTMTAILSDATIIEINIDIIQDYYNKTKEFVNYVQELIWGPKE